MQRVITLVRHTLQDLKLAIDGTIIMSEVSRGGRGRGCGLLIRQLRSTNLWL